MRARDYANALTSLLSETPKEKHDTIIKHFTETVAKNGHRALFPKIVRNVETSLRKDKERSTITIRSSHELTEKEVSEILKSEPFVRVLSGKEKIVEREVDPTLIGGIVVQTRERTVDQSQKRILQELYTQLTA